ncbi:esterase-like activity of phytase family protein [Tautonia marina]|uniref:esterase-like activity of phytase family protein n=1 Tax=Tautonia marina TaxID=2653855 RepID=UPI001260F047|nr:esterase-like activity of phytase family protein [Tautonia marina]
MRCDRVAVAMLLAISGQVWAVPIEDPPIVPDVAFLGQATLPGNATVEGTRVGGLSGLVFDEATGTYLAISDDKGGPGMPAPRVYRLSATLEDGKLNQGGVRLESVLELTRADGSRVPEGSVDAEGIALGPNGDLFISAEGMPNASPPVPPSVDRFDGTSGRYRRSMEVPEAYLPALQPRRGVRSNLAFESLTTTPGGRFLDTATENALHQDGPAASVERGSPCRIVRFDTDSGMPVAEFVYHADAIVGKTGANVAGLVELLAIDGTRWLALERSFSTGSGFTVRLYEASLTGATNVLGVASLTERDDVVPVRKQLLLDLGTIEGFLPTNLEGMAFGPDLEDGRRLVILMADNQLMTFFPSQFVALGVTIPPR